MYIALDTALKKTTQDPGRSSSGLIWSTDTVFMDKWVELPKYGLGYSLINGARGALFNDATSLTTNDDKYEQPFLFVYVAAHAFLCYRSFNYIVHGNYGSPSMATVYHIDYIPKDIEKKVRLMASYKSYMEEKLMGLGEMIPEAAAQLHINTYSIPYVSKYVATEEAVVFRLSNCTMQVNGNHHV
ncbi:hypothetical protein BCR43DRAFT_322776 [Syncephalastrum racemosum]|uniref:Uncharacterized protein n=1 Tax=Syncephalastrum racemosum TaxID=13706 RepID=A0A1X2H7H7_SYNRA|nr:hypothetical protein BCR43DRAFT_322776 [Syncephalastrum racemosum]